MATLTITIPTFDRNETLRANVAVLLPQLTADCRVLILDNHSRVPVAETLRELMAAHPEAAVTVIRHRANIGCCANIMRCLELCETEWVWILGDDDTPTAGAITSILHTLAGATDEVAFNFSSTGVHTRTADYRTVGSGGFVRGIDSFNNAMFISAYIYNAPKLAPHLLAGYTAVQSMAPHLATLITALSTDGAVRFCAAALTYRDVDPEVSQRWSAVRLVLSLGLLHDVDSGGFSWSDRARLAELMYASSLSWRTLCILLVIQTRSGLLSPDRAVYIVDQVCARYLWFHRRRLRWKMRAWLARVLVRMPGLTWRLFRIINAIRPNATSSRFLAMLSDIPLQQRI